MESIQPSVVWGKNSSRSGEPSSNAHNMCKGSTVTSRSLSFGQKTSPERPLSSLHVFWVPLNCTTGGFTYPNLTDCQKQPVCTICPDSKVTWPGPHHLSHPHHMRYILPYQKRQKSLSVDSTIPVLLDLWVEEGNLTTPLPTPSFSSPTPHNLPGTCVDFIK